MLLTDIKYGWGKKILSIFNQFLFLTANVILYFFFLEFIQAPQWVFGLVYLLSFLIIGKFTEWFYFIWYFILIGLILNLNINWTLPVLVIYLIISFISLKFLFKEKEDKDKKGKQIKLWTGLKFLLVLPRITFYSIAYYFFPLLVIWSFTFGMVIFLNIASISLFTQFATILGLTGIILGFLQFYLERYEQKVQQKVVHSFTTKLIPVNEFSFPAFKKYVDSSTTYNCNQIRSLVKDIKGNHLNYLVNTINKRYGNPNMTIINQNYGDESAYFTHIEMSAEKENKKEVLLKVYADFFKKVKNTKLESLKKENLSSIQWLLLGNVNILDEAQAVISSQIGSDDIEPKSYVDYIQKTTFEIVETVIDDLIYK